VCVQAGLVPALDRDSADVITGSEHIVKAFAAKHYSFARLAQTRDAGPALSIPGNSDSDLDADRQMDEDELRDYQDQLLHEFGHSQAAKGPSSWLICPARCTHFKTICSRPLMVFPCLQQVLFHRACLSKKPSRQGWFLPWTEIILRDSSTVITGSEHIVNAFAAKHSFARLAQTRGEYHLQRPIGGTATQISEGAGVPDRNISQQEWCR